jgi:methylated-DNA-[protein]-cysteine S-methyltransferase
MTNTIHQLEFYVKGELKTFNLPLLIIGTDFQKEVWRTLLTVPYGVTHSYSYLAKKVGDEKAVRAVANANGANPFSIIVPCHRIIGKNGKLTGYAGGLDTKEALLLLEATHN